QKPKRMQTPASSIDRPVVVASGVEMREFVRQQQRAGKRVGVVPTMGALHAGHLSLVERSVRHCDATVVTIFVNPKQFGAGEDFSRYPRMIEHDLSLLAPLGVDRAFIPAEAEMYPPGFATHVEV